MLCVFCHFETELDDVQIVFQKTRTCVCLRCYIRTVNDERKMSKTLRNSLQFHLATL